MKTTTNHIFIKCPYCQNLLDSNVYNNGLLVSCHFCRRTFRLWKNGFKLLDWLFTTQLQYPPKLPPASEVLLNARPDLPSTPTYHIPTDMERLRWINEELSAGAYGDVMAREDHEAEREASWIRDAMDCYRRECEEWSKRWDEWVGEVKEWNQNHHNDQITIPTKPIPATEPIPD